MDVLVPVKIVIDYDKMLRIKADGSGVDAHCVKWIVNPFDEVAVEEGIRLKEAGKVNRVIAVSIGPDDVVAKLRHVLAMGADSAVFVKYDGVVDSDLASRVLTRIYASGQYGLVIMGKQAVDSGAGQTGQLLAARLELPQACFASRLRLENGFALVTREVDEGRETLKIPMPCVITVDLRLNVPRCVTVRGHIEAKAKSVEQVPIEALAVDTAPKIKVVRMLHQLGRRGRGRRVYSVEELVSVLKDEAKVL